MQARGRLAGAARAGLGDPIVVQHSGATTFIGDYDAQIATSAGGHVPVTRNLVTGEEFVAGAIMLADGRVWVQGWRASRTNQGMRRMATAGGEVELPAIGYTYVPVSALIENGGAVVVDAGDAGRFALSVKVSGSVPNVKLDCGRGRELRLFNVTGALRGTGLSMPWFMTPNHTETMNEAVYAQVMLGRDTVDGPYNDAAVYVNELLGERYGKGDLRTIGPLLGLRHESDPEALAETVRAKEEALIRALPRIRPAAFAGLARARGIAPSGGAAAWRTRRSGSGAIGGSRRAHGLRPPDRLGSGAGP